jgi:uncharacterized membrane protein
LKEKENLNSFSEVPLIIDGGQYGSITHYTLVITFVSAAFIIFLYLWKTNKLDMDEEPKLIMMRDEEDHE